MAILAKVAVAVIDHLRAFGSQTCYLGPEQYFCSEYESTSWGPETVSAALNLEESRSPKHECPRGGGGSVRHGRAADRGPWSFPRTPGFADTPDEHHGAQRIVLVEQRGRHAAASLKNRLRDVDGVRLM